MALEGVQIRSVAHLKSMLCLWKIWGQGHMACWLKAHQLWKWHQLSTSCENTLLSCVMFRPPTLIICVFKVCAPWESLSTRYKVSCIGGTEVAHGSFFCLGQMCNIKIDLQDRNYHIVEYADGFTQRCRNEGSFITRYINKEQGMKGVWYFRNFSCIGFFTLHFWIWAEW